MGFVGVVVGTAAVALGGDVFVDTDDVLGGLVALGALGAVLVVTVTGAVVVAGGTVLVASSSGGFCGSGGRSSGSGGSAGNGGGVTATGAEVTSGEAFSTTSVWSLLLTRASC